MSHHSCWALTSHSEPQVNVERELAQPRQLLQLGASRGRLVTPGVCAWLVTPGVCAWPAMGWLVAGERCRPVRAFSWWQCRGLGESLFSTVCSHYQKASLELWTKASILTDADFNSYFSREQNSARSLLKALMKSYSTANNKQCTLLLQMFLPTRGYLFSPLCPSGVGSWEGEEERAAGQEISLRQVSRGWDRSKVEIALGDSCLFTLATPLSCTLSMLPRWRFLTCDHGQICVAKF